MASDSWFYAKDGQQNGPATTQALQQMLASGQISGQDLVWQEGMANWQPAGSVPALAPQAQGGYGVSPPAYAPQPSPYGQPQNPPIGYASPQVNAGQVPYGGYAAPSPYQSKATTAFVLSIIGIFCFGIVLGPIAIIMGLGAKSGMQATGDDRGKGLATAAVVIGSIEIVLFILWLAVMFGTASID